MVLITEYLTVPVVHPAHYTCLIQFGPSNGSAAVASGKAAGHRVGGALFFLFLPVYNPQIRFAPTTNPNVSAAISTSPSAPTMNGRNPCFDIALMFVRNPTPANVSRNAHRDRFPKADTWSLLNRCRLTSNEINRNPSTNFGNLFHRNAALLSTTPALPCFAQ